MIMGIAMSLPTRKLKHLILIIYYKHYPVMKFHFTISFN